MNVAASWKLLTDSLKEVGLDGRDGYQRTHDRWYAGLSDTDRKRYDHDMEVMCNMFATGPEFDRRARVAVEDRA